MRTVNLFFRLTAYYVILFGLLWAAFSFFPDVAQYVPIGDVEGLLVQSGDGLLEQIEIQASHVTSRSGGLLWLIFAILGSVLLMLPVSWVYIDIRSRAGMDQSLIQTMLVLPVAVAGIVLVVHNSLALAFSLAGIVAGVRFRTTLRNTADSLFIFMAVGVGLASGVGMLVIAAVMSVLFNYLFLVLWTTDYGHHKKGIRYMRRHLTRDELANVADGRKVDFGSPVVEKEGQNNDELPEKTKV